MGIFDNGLKGNIFTGLAIGIGAAVLAPTVLPVLVGAAKPLVKAAIKGGIILYEKGKENLQKLVSGGRHGCRGEGGACRSR